MKDLEKVEQAVKLLNESGVRHLLVYKEGEHHFSSDVACTIMDALQIVAIISKNLAEEVKGIPKPELIEMIKNAVKVGVGEGWEDGENNEN